MAADLRRIEDLLEQILENQTNFELTLSNMEIAINAVTSNQRHLESEVRKLTIDITNLKTKC